MFNFVDYMRTTAEKSKDIQHSEQNPHFHRITNLSLLEELIQNNGSVEGFQMIVEDVMEGSFGDNGGTIYDVPTFRFYIVVNVRTDDWDAKEEAKRACKIIGKKILGRMRRHQFTDSKFETSYGLKDLDKTSIQYFSIGPIIDNCWGVEFSFSLIEKSGIAYDANDWDE